MASFTRFRPLIPSLVIIIFCLTASVTHSAFAFTQDTDTVQHALFSFSHANIFHLLANMTALLYFQPRVSTCIVAYISAVVASYIPFVALDIPTMGLSAFVFAAYARKFYFWQLPVRGVVISNLIVAWVPFLNWRIHIAAFAVSYLIWMAYDYASVYFRRI